MKAKIILPGLTLLAILSSLNMQLSNLQAQGTAFTYQGRLISGGSPASGVYDIAFSLYSTSIGGGVLAGPVTNSAVLVTNGLFTTTVDFGRNAFTGESDWLQIAVSTNAANAFGILAPRQPVTPVPYALFANSASNLTGIVAAGQISGTLSPANIGAGTITGTMLAPDAVTMLGTPGNGATNTVNVSSNGLVGIGTGAGTPAAGLQIATGASITSLGVSFAVQNGQQGWTNIGGPYAAAINGNILALGGQTGLTLASITNPSSPVLLTQIAAASGSYANLPDIITLAWAGPNLVVGSYAYHGIPGAVFIIGCANPSSPVKLAELRNGIGGWTNLNNVIKVAVSGNLLAILSEASTAASNTVTLADISNPAAPVLKSTIVNGVNGMTNLDNIRGIALSGNLLVLGGEGGVTLADVSNPGNPTKLAELVQGMGGYTNLDLAFSLAVSGNLLAISDDFSATTLVNVGNPMNPVYLAGIHGFAGQVAFSNNRLVIASGYNSEPVALFDISNPASPVLLAGVPQAFTSAYNLTEIHDMAFAGTNIVTFGYGNSVVFPNSPEGAVTIFGIGTQSAGLSSAGWVGIGTTLPAAPLDVVGNVLVENATSFQVESGQVALGTGAAAEAYISTALGYFTTASGLGATAMGALTTAGGRYSTAMGYGAVAAHDYSFVWADGSSYPAFSSTMTNQFLILAAGGVGINTNVTAGAALTVNGDERLTGLLRSGSETGTSQTPSPAGLVVRRINSTLEASNSIVAVVYNTNKGPGENTTLVRDGTAGGFQIKYPASPGYLTIACMGIDTNGVARNFYIGKANPATAGTVQIYTDAQAIVHFECTFGDTYDSGQHLTRITLSRFYGGGTLDYYWSGELISTVNQ